jgi:hypothetical protein
VERQPVHPDAAGQVRRELLELVEALEELGEKVIPRSASGTPFSP